MKIHRVHVNLNNDNNMRVRDASECLETVNGRAMLERCCLFHLTKPGRWLYFDSGLMYENLRDGTAIRLGKYVRRRDQASEKAGRICSVFISRSC